MKLNDILKAQRAALFAMLCRVLPFGSDTLPREKPRAKNRVPLASEREQQMLSERLGQTELRPVETRFERILPASPLHKNARARRATYEVLEHRDGKEVIRMVGFEKV